MIEIIWLYALGGFLLGLIFSTLWEWLFFRQKRLRIENSRITELEETVRSLSRATVPDAMPHVDAWSTPGYESPGVFLESEEGTMRTRAAQPQVLQVEPPSPVRMTVNPTDGYSSSSASGFEYDTQRAARRRVSPLIAATAATAAGMIAASQPDPASTPPTNTVSAASAPPAAAGAPEPASQPAAPSSPALSPLAAGAIVAAMTAAAVATSQAEPASEASQTEPTPPTPAVVAPSAEEAPAAASTGQTEPAATTDEDPAREPMTAAALATLAAAAGAIHAATSHSESTTEPETMADGEAIVAERDGTAEEIAGVVVLAALADQADADEEAAILPAKIDTLVAKIEHLIDTMGATQPAGEVSPDATADTAVALRSQANALTLAEPPTAEGDNTTATREFDGTYTAKNLSRGEYAVVQVMQATRKTWRDLRALYGKRLATRPSTSQDVRAGLRNGPSNPAVPTAPDDLTRIPGLTAAQAERLHLTGITSYHRLAGVSKDELSQIFASPTGDPPPDFDVWQVSARLLAAQPESVGA